MNLIALKHDWRLQNFKRWLFTSSHSKISIAMHTTRQPRRDVMKIELTDNENRLCELLDGCTKKLNQDMGISTTCRIAGGWVRDKLLGSQSNDIDIAMSHIMGLAFAEHFSAFAQQNGIETGTISRIAQNPAQSKHLETATCKILNLDLDFVNLRSEEYANDSRIPTEVAFGTPTQDALRRDITINSLFYNVHTRDVEDFTEKGLDDLRNGLIRTPLPPRETLLDDPLRVLRCIRFSSRFGFPLTPDLKDAAKDLQIHDALVTKVARERAGEEIAKMMRGPDPLGSIKLIHELSLYHPIFSAFPHGRIPQLPQTHTALTAAKLLNMLLNFSNQDLPTIHPKFLTSISIDPSCKARLYLAAAVTPYKGATYHDHKNKIHSAIDLVLRESLKLGTQNHYLDGIPLLFAAAGLLTEHLTNRGIVKASSERVAIGLLLRNKAIHNINTGSHYTTSILFSLLQELVPLYSLDDNKLDVRTASRIINSYNSFMARIEELKLTEVPDARPLLDGHEIVKLLGARKSGPWVGQVLSQIITWQLEHPEKTRDDCILWLSNEKVSGNLDWVEDSNFEPANKRVRMK